MNRRKFLKTAVAASGAATLMKGLPGGWVGSVYADDSPETPNMRFGMIALTDCSPIVIAHEKASSRSTASTRPSSKEAIWAAIRDTLSIGDNQATHMLIGMPFASTMGLVGSPKKPMVIPWLLNRNGQAITLNNRMKKARS